MQSKAALVPAFDCVDEERWSARRRPVAREARSASVWQCPFEALFIGGDNIARQFQRCRLLLCTRLFRSISNQRHHPLAACCDALELC